jgi:putative flippase GtrA
VLKFSSQFTKFGLVGLINTLIHAVILFAAVEVSKLHPVVGNFMAFLGANMASFIMNSYWTFKTAPEVRRYGKFLTSSLLALGLTLGIAGIFEFLAIHYGLGFLCIIFLVPALNYWMLKRWAFAGH